MSRQAIRDAIQKARQGQVDEAVELLRPEAAGSVRNQLGKLASTESALAQALWSRLFPGEELPQASTGAGTEPESERVEGERELPPRVELANPGSLLGLLADPHLSRLSLADSFILQAWGIVGLAARARVGERNALQVDLDVDSNGARFAHALGFDDAVVGKVSSNEGEPGRTVRVRRLTDFLDLEPLANRISRLIAPRHESVQKTLYFVLVELLRNVLQHSRDPLGAVVGAQLMTQAQQYVRDAVQVAVADTGIGILTALKGMHPELTDPGAAIEKAIRPHISGTFEEGLTGSDRNAGFGLFVVSELAKLGGGRLLIASRGAALLIRPDPQHSDRHVASMVSPPGTGFPGTLVAFEIPLAELADFPSLMEAIRDRARTQTPQRHVHRWIRYDAPPPGARPILVRISVENTERAAQVARSISSQIIAGDPILLDFAGLDFVTQSFLHSLLFRPLRLAWAEQQPVYVANAAPAVRSAIETFEQYALSG